MHLSAFIFCFVMYTLVMLFNFVLCCTLPENATGYSMHLSIKTKSRLIITDENRNHSANNGLMILSNCDHEKILTSCLE